MQKNRDKQRYGLPKKIHRQLKIKIGSTQVLVHIFASFIIFFMVCCYRWLSNFFFLVRARASVAKQADQPIVSPPLVPDTLPTSVYGTEMKSFLKSRELVLVSWNLQWWCSSVILFIPSITLQDRKKSKQEKVKSITYYKCYYRIDVQVITIIYSRTKISSIQDRNRIIALKSIIESSGTSCSGILEQQ